MKKRLLAVVFVAIFICGLVPFYAGMRAEAELNRLVELIAAHPGYSASWTRYQRGWLGTRAQLGVALVTVDTDTGRRSTMDIPLEISVSHGPLLFGEQQPLGWFSYGLQLPEQNSEFLRGSVSKVGAGNLVQSEGYMGLDGTLFVNNRVMPFTVNSENLTMAFAGYTGTGRVSPEGILRYNGDAGELICERRGATETLSAKMGELHLELVSDYGRQVPGTNLVPSKAVFTLPSLETTLNGERSVLRDIAVTAEAALPENGKVVNFMIDTQVGQGEVSQQVFTALTLTMAYKRISIELIKQYLAMQGALLGDPSGQTDIQRYFTADVLRETLGYKPEFSLSNVSITTPEGGANGQLTVLLEQAEAMNPAQLVNALAWVNLLTVNLDVQMDKSLAKTLAQRHATASVESQLEMERLTGVQSDYSDEQKQEKINYEADMLLQALMRQGVLLEDEGGKSYSAKMNFEKGNTLLNGNSGPLPLAILMQFAGH